MSAPAPVPVASVPQHSQLQGIQSNHCWRNVGASVQGSAAAHDKFSQWICTVCASSFKHYYDLQPDIFETMHDAKINHRSCRRLEGQSFQDVQDIVQSVTAEVDAIRTQWIQRNQPRLVEQWLAAMKIMEMEETETATKTETATANPITSTPPNPVYVPRQPPPRHHQSEPLKG